jgi:hypothetical protein
MHIITECPRCLEDFMYHRYDTHLLRSDNVVCQDCDAKERFADSYAIEFAEWSVARAMGLDSFKLNNGELEQFKKEKGL